MIYYAARKFRSVPLIEILPILKRKMENCCDCFRVRCMFVSSSPGSQFDLIGAVGERVGEVVSADLVLDFVARSRWRDFNAQQLKLKVHLGPGTGPTTSGSRRKRSNKTPSTRGSTINELDRTQWVRYSPIKSTKSEKTWWPRPSEAQRSQLNRETQVRLDI